MISRLCRLSGGNHNPSFKCRNHIILVADGHNRLANSSVRRFEPPIPRVEVAQTYPGLNDAVQPTAIVEIRQLAVESHGILKITLFSLIPRPKRCGGKRLLQCQRHSNGIDQLVFERRETEFKSKLDHI